MREETIKSVVIKADLLYVLRYASETMEDAKISLVEYELEPIYAGLSFEAAIFDLQNAPAPFYVLYEYLNIDALILYGTIGTNFFRIGMQLGVDWDFGWFTVAMVRFELMFEAPLECSITFGGEASSAGALADVIGPLDMEVLGKFSILVLKNVEINSFDKVQ